MKDSESKHQSGSSLQLMKRSEDHLFHDLQTIASHLFERSPTQEYIEEWTEALMQHPSPEKFKGALSVMVFRLGREWLALPTICFKEVAHRRPVHRIPHRSDKILLGIVNLNGELKLCVAAHQLLEIESFTLPGSNSFSYHYDRMIAIAKEGDLWVFPVDEIDGIYDWDLAVIEKVPVNLSKSTANFLKGIMKMGNKSVGLLDEELLFSSLKRSIQ